MNLAGPSPERDPAQTAYPISAGNGSPTAPSRNLRIAAYLGLLSTVVGILAAAYKIGAPPIFLIGGTFVATVLLILFVLLEFLLRSIGPTDPTVLRVARATLIGIAVLVFCVLITASIIFFIALFKYIPDPKPYAVKLGQGYVSFPRVLPASQQFIIESGSANNKDEQTLYRIAMDDAMKWLSEGGATTDPKRMLLFAESAPDVFVHSSDPNASIFEEFSGVITVDGLRIEHAIAFLYREKDGITPAKVRVYEQQPLKITPREEAGDVTDSTASYHIIDARKGDRIWLFLGVVSSETIEKTNFSVSMTIN